ncbi:hypothetical protein HY628_03185 [Candidatus Uhrbacteria bacterium]|nr:hypothetical protein [Candidatus Uhrbacteria bacterium]
MRYSQLFAKTEKTAPHEAESINAQLLCRGGFVNQLAAGIYTYLPLGLRVMEKIRQIIRQEMNVLGGQEILMPALTPKELWIATGRWDEIDVLFKLEGHGEKEYALGSTHEEVVTPLVKRYVRSYRDLPLAVYQIQTKFRNEPRAKSGLLRGREFLMKDLYSFHLSEDDFLRFYELAKQAYLKIFSRCGLRALIVEASGGVFSKYSHEFQVATPAGEDIVFVCDCGFAQNREIAGLGDGDPCPSCGKKVRQEKTIEVGNIFPLKTRFTDAFDFKLAGPDGEMLPILMGCYGIGLSRVMGAIVEVHHDGAGIVWPKSVAPFAVHLMGLSAKDEIVNAQVETTVESLYDSLTREEKMEALYDDRQVSAGEKFADADLVGIPLRLVVSERTLKEDAVEWKPRSESEGRLVKLGDLPDELLAYLGETEM